VSVQQRDETWVKAATPEQIVAAQNAGELNDLLGRPRPLPTAGQLTAEDIQGRTAEEIEAARVRGQLVTLLSRQG
jgi:hypothetical protein